jgi:hypothetical protein
MQRDIARNTEMLRALEEPQEPLSARQTYFMQLDNPAQRLVGGIRHFPPSTI